MIEVFKAIKPLMLSYFKVEVGYKREEFKRWNNEDSFTLNPPMGKCKIPLGVVWSLVEKERLYMELLNEVKRSIQKLIKSNEKLEIMERDSIMRMVKLIGRYHNIKAME
jgi:hypothetical protein